MTRRVALLAALLAIMPLVIGAFACARILGIRPPGKGSFEHRAHVLRGINCLRCHPGIVRTGDDSPLNIPGTAECMKCHEKPHDRRDCSLCHGTPFAREGVAAARHFLRFQHKTHVARLKGSCVRCHSDVARETDRLRPGMATCLSCHPHDNNERSQDCAFCHVDLRSEGAKPQSHLAHDGDFLREHGTRAASSRELCANCHSQRFCASCHGVTVPGLAEKLAFDEPGKAGVHRAGFRSRHSEQARGQPGLCLTCHSIQVCNDCHGEKGISAPRSQSGSPHRPGWVGLRGEPNLHGSAARRDPVQCAACHTGAGEMLCVGCHREGGVGGNPHAPGWASRLRKTIDMPCRLCHEGAL